jgi:uncharacterized protein
MIINVKDIPITGKEYELDLDEETLDLDMTLLAPVHFTGTLYRSGQDVRIQGHLTTEVENYCHRCLELTVLHVDTDFEVFYKPKPTGAAAAEEEVPIEELGVLYYRDSTIDLCETARDTIILEIPMKVLCQEGCRGLCPFCGANLNKNGCDCACQKQETGNPFKEFFEKHGT